MTALTATPTSARTTATRCRVGLEDIADEGPSLAAAPAAFNVATRARTSAASRGRARQGLVERLLECARVLSVLYPPSVDEERRGGVDAHARRFALIRFDRVDRLAPC